MGLKDVITQVTEAIERSNEVMEKSKKLTTKDRKSMKKSTFCGPNRSFPIPDCKHVAVAKTYLKRAKFSESTKKKIAACINRKAKSLGCNVSKKAKAFTELEYDEKKLSESDVFKTTRNMVEESINNPGMDLEFTNDCC